MKTLTTLPIAILSLVSLSTNAGVFENWNQNISYAQPISVAGIIWPTYYATYTNVTNSANRWLVNTHNSNCISNLAGPNQCYSMSNGKLYYHGEDGPDGDGVLLASNQEFNIQNGMIVEGSFNSYCTNTNNGCWVNIGIYVHEGNYRSIGFKSTGGNSAYFNIWGPDAEVGFNGSVYSNLPLVNGTTHHYKLQYWNNNGTWRWDYFLDNTWIAGHNAPDNEYYMGAGNFDNARIEIAYGGYQTGPHNGGNSAAAEGYFETIEYQVW